MTKHTHRVDTQRVTPYAGPVSRDEEPRAHGNICKVQKCKCGAIRLVNVNFKWTERGPWLAPDPAKSQHVQ